MSEIDEFSFKRTEVAQFDGTPSKLKAFITDISMFLTYKKINHTTDDGKKQAASIVYIHLTEDVRKIVRQMSVEVLNDYTALIQELKSTFGIREADELTTFMREFNSIRQNANEYLRDYLVRCEILAHKIKAIDPAIDLITMAGGKLLTYQVREGIRNPAVRSILTLDGEATWAQFKLKGMNLSQTDTIETSAEHKSANIGSQLPYKPPGDKRPAANNAKYYCSLHGKNATHDTNQCRTLAYNNSKNKKSSGNNGGTRGGSSKTKHTGKSNKNAHNNGKHRKKGKGTAFPACEEGTSDTDSDEESDTDSDSDDTADKFDGQALMAALKSKTHRKKKSKSCHISKASRARKSCQFALLDQKVAIFDPAASPTSASRGYLELHNIKYDVIERHQPPKRIRTASGIVPATFTARIKFLNNRVTYSIDVLIMDTDRVTPILFGSNALRKAGATFDFMNNIMTLKSGTQLFWDYSKTSGLWFLKITQPSNPAVKSDDVQPKNAFVTTKIKKDRKSSGTAMITALVAYNDENAESLPPLTDSESDSDDVSDTDSESNIQTLDTDDEDNKNTYFTGLSATMANNQSDSDETVSSNDDKSDTESNDTIVKIIDNEGNDHQIDKSTLNTIVESLHIQLGHAGIKACYEAIKPHFAGKAIRDAIANVAKKCDVCARIKHPYPSTYKHGKIQSTYFNECVDVDLVQYESSINGETMVFTAIDEKTNYYCALPMKNKTAIETLKAFKLGWIAAHGLPANVRRDAGTEFKKEFEEYLKDNGVNIITSPIAHPSSNGKVEGRHRDMHIAIRAELRERNLPTNRWPDVIDAAITKLNRRPSSAKSHKGMSPYEMLHGVKPNIPAISFLKSSIKSKNNTLQNKEEAKYKPGDKVLYKHPEQKRGKLEDVYLPYTVVSSTGGNNLVYKIQADCNTQHVKDAITTAHVNSLRLRPQEPKQRQNNEQNVQKEVNNLPEKPPDIQIGQMIIWRDDETRHFYMGKVTECKLNKGIIKVHAYGTYHKAHNLSQRKFYPGWDSTLDGRTQYVTKRPNTLHIPEICTIQAKQIKEHGFTLDANKLPDALVNKYKNEINGCILVTAEEKLRFSTFAHVIQDENTAYINATTHQTVNYDSLTHDEETRTFATKNHFANFLASVMQSRHRRRRIYDYVCAYARRRNKLQIDRSPRSTKRWKCTTTIRNSLTIPSIINQPQPRQAEKEKNL